MNTEAQVELILREDCTYEGDKRQAFPYTIRWVCPGCGAEHETDPDYLSYPNMGRKAGPYSIALSCEGYGETADGGEEWYICWTGSVPVRLELYAEIVGPLKNDVEESPGSNR